MSRNPPSTLTASALGVSTPDTLASGVVPHTSSCACSLNRPVSHAQTLHSATTQAVPPSASATAADTSSMVRIEVW